MRTLYLIPRILSVGLFVVLIGCGSDAEKELLLLGKWSLDKASRNERQTTLLDHLVFEFEEEGRMTTNINGKPEQAKYELSNEVIYQTETSLNLNFEVIELSDTSLVLQTSIRDVPFEFFFKRAEEEDNLEE